LPLNAVTAVQALDLLALSPGQTLLVTGAAGALGEYTVVLAAQRGLKVVGLARAFDEDDVPGNGARRSPPSTSGTTVLCRPNSCRRGRTGSIRADPVTRACG
jgi:NAD(P)-dependent dehydrogenase (short-subunit alcohol dehydrogenase family)